MKAVLALIFGILGLLLIWLPVVGLVFAVLAIVFYALSKNDKAGKTLALIGLVLGIVAIVGQALILVGLFAMFGVMDVDRLVPSRCVMPGAMACLDHSYDGSNIILEFQNTAGRAVEFRSIELLNRDTDEICRVDSTAVVENNGIEGFNIPCTLTGEGMSRFEVYVTYNNQGSDLEKTNVGDLVIRG